MRFVKHLFVDGEFMPRARLLSGLTLEQVGRRVAGASHSIYEELWHLVSWQRVVVEREERTVEQGTDFPREQPASQAAWDGLVQAFLDGARRAVECGARADTVTGPGETMADALQCLAVHNAYHFGKIAALRQAMGAWPPPG